MIKISFNFNYNKSKVVLTFSFIVKTADYVLHKNDPLIQSYMSSTLYDLKYLENFTIVIYSIRNYIY